MALVQFAGAGDVYLAYSVSTDPVNISVVKPGPGLAFQAISFQDAQLVISGVPTAGIEPWVKSMNGPLDVNLCWSLPRADWILIISAWRL